MTDDELKALVARKATIRFKSAIEDCEGYAEAGMQGRLIGARETDHGIKISVDFTGFDEVNAPFESSNYYDKNGQPVLTARQSGYYNPQDTYWVEKDSLDIVFEVVATHTERLQTAYLDERRPGESYVEWLEAQAMPLTGEISFGEHVSLSFPDDLVDIEVACREALSVHRKFGIKTDLHLNVGNFGVVVAPDSCVQDLRDLFSGRESQPGPTTI